MDLNEIFPDWRFTPVRGKRPYLPDWQNLPFRYADIPYPENGYGLLLGPASGGVMALDFDGDEAWQFYAEHFGQDIETLCWASGKPDRMQAAYWVPACHWDDLATMKVGAGKKLEFRWTGAQSVIPLSFHPETGSYDWVDDAPRSAIFPSICWIFGWNKAGGVAFDRHRSSLCPHSLKKSGNKKSSDCWRSSSRI